MVLRNIVFSALVVGVLTGLLYGAFQHLQVSPIIFAAEQFEVADETSSTTTTVHHHSDGHSHHHDAEAWGPEDGNERTLYTLFTASLSGISFALVMISLMALHNHKSNKPKIDPVRGIVWGIAAMSALFIAPALFGLHPEVPGTVAATLENRQEWWIFCVLATAAGIAILYYAPPKIKALGLIFVATPHILGAPMPKEHGFANTDPTAVAALTELTHQFYAMTAIGMGIFFILLGVFSAYAVQKFVRLDDQSSSH